MMENKQFHSYIIKKVFNRVTGKDGWRIVGLWGEESRGEGNRIGPVFAEEDLDSCEEMVDALEYLYGLPVDIATIVSHFSNIWVGDEVEIDEGKGVVQEVRPGHFPFHILLDSGGSAWVEHDQIKR